jgi:hypothetical protein
VIARASFLSIAIRPVFDERAPVADVFWWVLAAFCLAPVFPASYIGLDKLEVPIAKVNIHRCGSDSAAERNEQADEHA